MSKNIPIPQLALDFDKPGCQTVADRYIRTQHRPKEVVSSNGNIVFEFTLNHNKYLSFDQSVLSVKGNIEDISGHKLDDEGASEELWSNIYPVNYLLHSMFKQVSIEINNEEITSQSQGYMYEAFLEALLTYSPQAKRSVLSAAAWLPKKEDRLALVKAGRKFDLSGKLHVDLAHQSKALYGGCNIRITLVPNNHSFFIKTDKDKFIPKLHIDDIYFESHKILVSEKYEADIRQAFGKKNTLKYNICTKRLKTISIPENSIDPILENVFTGRLPRMILFCLVKTSAFVGNYKEDPYEFKNFGLNFFQCFRDGVPFPTRPFTPNFGKGFCTREYLAFLQAIGQTGTDAYTSISYADFQKDRMIIAQNFSAGLSHGFDGFGLLDHTKEGNMQIQLRFDEPLTEPIKAIIYAEYDVCVEIDKDHNFSQTFQTKVL